MSLFQRRIHMITRDHRMVYRPAEGEVRLNLTFVSTKTGEQPKGASPIYVSILIGRRDKMAATGLHRPLSLDNDLIYKAIMFFSVMAAVFRLKVNRNLLYEVVFLGLSRILGGEIKRMASI